MTGMKESGRVNEQEEEDEEDGECVEEERMKTMVRGLAESVTANLPRSALLVLLLAGSGSAGPDTLIAPNMHHECCEETRDETRPAAPPCATAHQRVLIHVAGFSAVCWRGRVIWRCCE